MSDASIPVPSEGWVTLWKMGDRLLVTFNEEESGAIDLEQELVMNQNRFCVTFSLDQLSSPAFTEEDMA